MKIKMWCTSATTLTLGTPSLLNPNGLCQIIYEVMLSSDAYGGKGTVLFHVDSAEELSKWKVREMYEIEVHPTPVVIEEPVKSEFSKDSKLPQKE